MCPTKATHRHGSWRTAAPHECDGALCDRPLEFTRQIGSRLEGIRHDGSPIAIPMEEAL